MPGSNHPCLAPRLTSVLLATFPNKSAGAIRLFQRPAARARRRSTRSSCHICCCRTKVCLTSHDGSRATRSSGCWTSPRKPRRRAQRMRLSSCPDTTKAPVPSLSARDRGFPEVMRGLSSGAPREVRPKGLSNTSRVGAESGQQPTPAPLHSPIERHRKRDMPMRWAKRYDACVACGTSERPHRAKGRCKRCDDRWSYADRAQPR